MFVPLNIKTDSYLQSSMISINSLVDFRFASNFF